MMKILDRYLLKELAGPFLFGVAAFTSILLASSVLFELIRMMVQYHMGIQVVAKVTLLRLPEIMFYTFPMSMLLASLLAVGRLSGESEIVAMKASGISLYRIISPFILIGVVVSLLTVILNEYVVPQASFAAKQIMVEATTQKKVTFTSENIIYREMDPSGQLQKLFYAAKFDGTAMRRVVVQDFEKGQMVRIVVADSAAWERDHWTFRDGHIYLLNTAGEYTQKISFKEQVIPLKQEPLTLARNNKEPLDMNFSELSQRIEILKKSGEKVNQLEVQLYQKLAVPFASLIFVLVGAPLGMRPQRSSSGIGLGISIIIIFIYYVLMFISLALGEIGTLPPLVAAWIPNLVAGSIGGYLIYRAGR